MTGLKYWLTVNFLQRKFLLKNCPLKKKSVKSREKLAFFQEAVAYKREKMRRYAQPWYE